MRRELSPRVRANRIRRARESKGLTQKDVAALVDAWPSQVHYWETIGRKPTTTHLVRLSGVLGVPLDYLMVV